MRFYRPGARVCARTGLLLVPAGGEREFRVALTSYGALNPPVRGPAGSDVGSWSRHDTPGGRTDATRRRPGGARSTRSSPGSAAAWGSGIRWSRTPLLSG